MPIGYAKLFTDARHNWLYNSEPEPELGGRQIIQPRGKVMGGSSSINGLLYIRGQAEDFDHWRQLGNAGWSFADVLPYFRTRRGPGARRGRPARRAAVRSRSRCERAASAVRSLHRCVRAGRPAAHERFQRAEPGGRGLFPAHHAQGPPLVDRARVSGGGAQAAQSRRGVECADHAHPVRRAPRGRRRVQQGRRDAHGACERRSDPLRAARSTRRNCCSFPASVPATCCASTASMSIADMKGVGADLQDHYQARFNYRCTERITMNDMMNSPLGRVAAGLRYALFRKGFLTVGAGYAGGFFKTDPKMATPDVQFHFILFSADAVGQKLHPWPGFLASVCQLRPESRGFVRIKSADPAQAPAIQPRYLTAAGRSRRDGCRHEAVAPRDGAAGDRALHRRGDRCRAPKFRATNGLLDFARAEGHDRIPPDLDLPHGLGRDRRGGRAAARAWLPGFARRRRLDHADGRVRQHQRGLRDDRREGLRHDAGGRDARRHRPSVAA